MAKDSNIKINENEPDDLKNNPLFVGNNSESINLQALDEALDKFEGSQIETRKIESKLSQIYAMSQVSLNLIDAYVKSGDPEVKQVFMESMRLMDNMVLDYGSALGYSKPPEETLEDSPETP